jgi:hypothetical protein
MFNKIVKQVCSLAVVGLLAACSHTNPERWMAFEDNACLPTAIAMVEGLQRQGVQARVVRYLFVDDEEVKGHAIAAYLYPPGANQLWTYDRLGSWRTRAFWDDPLGIAAAAERQRGGRYVTFAEFLEAEL